MLEFGPRSLAPSDAEGVTSVPVSARLVPDRSDVAAGDDCCLARGCTRVSRAPRNPLRSLLRGLGLAQPR